MNYQTLYAGTAAVALLSASSLFVCSPAQAQRLSGQTSATEDVAADEILVTARRREEALIDVPFSLQVLSGAELERIGAVNAADFVRNVAGVQLQDKGSGRWLVYMRGVSTGGDVDTGKESTVGIYFDETVMSEASSQPDLKLFDIDRVEVLRGPQGTLFGSGSLSGTLRILPRQPNIDQVEGSVQAQVSQTRFGGMNYMGNATVNLPLSDKAAVRVVGYHVRNAGFLRNGFTGEDDINDEHSWGGRAALLLRPTENLDVTLTGIYQRSKFGAYYQATDHFPDLVIDQDAPEPFNDRYAVGSLKINYGFDGATLTSVSSYLSRRRHFENDINYFTGFLGVPKAFSPLTYKSDTFTQEVRLASDGNGQVQWVVGAFFLDRHETALQTISPAGAPVPAPAATLALINRVTNTQQYAAFGEASYEVLPGLTATAGARIAIIEGNNTSINDGTLFGSRSRKFGSSRNTPFTPRFILSYKPSETAQLYAQAAKGFRIGGSNPGLPPCASSPNCTVNVGPSFDPDSVWNYEVGAKFNLLGGKLFVDTSLFYIDWDNIQVNVGRGDGFNGFMNAGAAETKGFEMSATAEVNDFLKLGGQFTYTKGKIVELGTGVAAAGVAEVGDRLPQIPEITASGYAEIGVPLGESGRIYTRGEVQFVDSRFGGFTSSQPYEMPAYTLLNLRIGYDSGPFSLMVFANNLTDKRAVLSEQSYSGLHNGAPYSWLRLNVNTPQTIGVSVTQRF